MILGRPLDAIQANELQSLVGTQEGLVLDAKLQLPGGSDGERKEFCRDISSFANAAGGLLVYGADEKDGMVTAIPGVKGTNTERERSRLLSMAEAGIRPRIVGLEVRSFTVNGADAYLVRVPQSWNRPHQSIIAGDQSFWTRTSEGKRPMDVDELRSAFGGAQQNLAMARNLRRQRLAAIEAGETPVPIPPEASFAVLHVVPLAGMDGAQVIDLTGVKTQEMLGPMAQHVYGTVRFNADGLCHAVAGTGDEPWSYYTQVNRNGVVEAVATPITSTGPTGLYLHKAIIVQAADMTKASLKFLKDRGVRPPFLVGLILCRVKDSRFQLSQIEPWTHKVDRDTLVPPEVTFETGEEPVESTLRPIFDALWNASGYSKCPGFDDKGNLIRG